MNYFVSDYHFFHRNIFDYEPIRKQFDESIILSYEKEMIKRYNQKVKEEDTVYFVGDIFCGFNQFKKAFNLSKPEKDYSKAILEKMNGKKILIRGNHDHKSDNWYKDLGFKEVEYIIEMDNFLICHYPLCEKYWNKPFIKKEQREMWKEFIEYFENSKKYCIHGHTHSRESGCRRHFNVSVDVNNFEPVSESDIKDNFLINS